MQEAVEDFTFRLYEIDPQDTNPEIRIRRGKHLALVPEHVPPRDELFVFIPGTGAGPRSYEYLASIAAFAGYRVVTLAYPNDYAVRNICLDYWQNCTIKIRREILYGIDSSDLIDIEEADALVPRLLSLLQYLDDQFPGDNWKQFYEGDIIRWDKIVAAGHSQGGGHTAALALDHELARAVHFSKYGDTCKRCGRIPEPWTLLPRKTPPERQFSFHHKDEHPHLKWREMFDMQGLGDFGPTVDAYIYEEPWGCSHTLVTTIPAERPHSVTAHDDHIVFEDGVSVHEEVYRYLFTAERDAPAPD